MRPSTFLTACQPGCARTGRPPPEFSTEALSLLLEYSWPGNVRELRNVLERALLFTKGDRLDRSALRFDRILEPVESGGPLQTLDDAERSHIVNVLRRAGGQVDRAAEVLALSRSSLYAKLKKYGLKAQAD